MTALAPCRAVRAARLAFAWAARHPELKGSLYRALDLVYAVEPDGRDAYLVSGRGAVYRVEVDRARGASRCECEAWRYAKVSPPRCKHTLAVALWERSGEEARAA